MMRRIAKVSLLSFFCASSPLMMSLSSSALAAEQAVLAQVAQDERVEDLVSMLASSLVKFADKPLFGVKNGDTFEWITYKQFGENVDWLRGGLAQLGVKKNTKVAIIADNSPEWASSCYATLGRRAVFVPMYTSQSMEEWTYKLTDSQAKVLIVANTKIYDKVKHLVGNLGNLQHIINLEEGSEAEHSYHSLLELGKANPTPAKAAKADDLMGLIYTSGTTGDAKGVMLTHGNIASTLDALPKVVPIEGERSLSFLPWAHIFGQLAELHAMIRLGNSAAIASAPPRSLPDDLKTVKPTIFFAVPTVFNRIYDKTNATATAAGGLRAMLFNTWRKVQTRRHNNEDSGFFSKQAAKLADKRIKSQIKESFGGELKIALSGGARLAPEVAHFIDDVGIIALEGYGMSETSGMISMNTLTDRKIGSVGKPFPGVDVVLDQSRMAADAADEQGHARGEILVRGPNIMMGYYNKPELTEQEFTEKDGKRYFRTGDVGYLDADGFLFITGRIKELYKLENGKYISPAAFEEKAKLSPFIKEAFLYGENKPHNVLLVVPDAEKMQGVEQNEIEQLISQEIAKAGESFPSYVRPKSFKIIDADWAAAGLMTPTLKVKRKAVEVAYKDELLKLYR